MVVLSKIYTRTGDDGTTALGSGRRVAKYDLRVECYGTLDETNAAIGLARLHTHASDPALDATLARIQNDLFDLGADLCLPRPADEKPGAALRVAPSQVQALEHAIDALNARLHPLRSFVLPGGTAFITDAGMCGDFDSIIGMDKNEPIRRFTARIPSSRFAPAMGPATICGVLVETDDATGLALSIEPVRDGAPLGAGRPR